MPLLGALPRVFVRPATLHDVAFLTDVLMVTRCAQGRLSALTSGPDYRGALARWLTEQIARPGEGEETSVIEIDGARAGGRRVVRAADHLELAGLELLPAHQGRGLGTQLIQQLLSETRTLRLPMRIPVMKDNPRARALYERLGFATVGEHDDELVLERIPA